MANVDDLKAYVSANRDALAELLPPESRQPFSEELDNVLRITNPALFERPFKAVIAKYPPAQAELERQGLLAPAPAAPPPPAPAPVLTAAKPRESEAPVPPVSPAAPPPLAATSAVAAAGAQAADGVVWERRITAGKEAVTGCLAVLIVGATLFVALAALFFAGAEGSWARAKDILVILSGLTGVVLGYYFGRVPADARAAQAQSQTQVAQDQAAEAETALARTQAVVETVVRSAERKATQRSDEGAASLSLTPEQLRQLESVLRR